MNTASNGKTELIGQRQQVVMVVEDEIWIRMMISDQFRSENFEVIECGSADEAIELLRGKIRVSIIFSDVQLPGSINGLALAQTVIDELPYRPILMLTSGEAQNLSGVRHDGFFAKPYDPAVVVKFSRSKLEQGNGPAQSSVGRYDGNAPLSGNADGASGGE